MLLPDPTAAPLMTLPTLIATAAPTPTPLLLPLLLPCTTTADPSAVALSLMTALEVMAAAPVATTPLFVPVLLCTVLLSMLTATAPATLIDVPLPDELPLPFGFATAALGSLPADELLRAPLLLAAESPAPRAPEAWSFTPFWSLPLFFEPPMALAVAFVVVVCWPLAATVTVPPAVVAMRLSCACVVSVITPTATDAPMPALLPLAFPVAVSVAVPVCVAVTFTLAAAANFPLPVTWASVLRLATV